MLFLSLLFCHFRNSEKTLAKIEDIENSIKGNKEKLEGLNKEMKQMEVDATKVLEDHTKAKVLWQFTDINTHLRQWG